MENLGKPLITSGGDHINDLCSTFLFQLYVKF